MDKSKDHEPRLGAKSSIPTTPSTRSPPRLQTKRPSYLPHCDHLPQYTSKTPTARGKVSLPKLAGKKFESFLMAATGHRSSSPSRPGRVLSAILARCHRGSVAADPGWKWHQTQSTRIRNREAIPSRRPSSPYPGELLGQRTTPLRQFRPWTTSSSASLRAG